MRADGAVDAQEWLQAERLKWSEAQFQLAVQREAKALGWRVYHTRDSRGSDPGFPDLVMVRAGRLVFAELKREKKSDPTSDQLAWLADLALVELHGDGASRVKAYLWRPSDWAQILAVLA